MKKFIALVCLFATTTLFAETLSVTIPAGGITNTSAVALSGTIKITQFILTSTATADGLIEAYDAPGTSLIYTNPAYIDVRSYATNVITCYTNFFGIQNCFTNVALVDVARTNVATTNTYPKRIVAAAGTNSSAVFGGVNYYFHQGILVTNTGPDSVTITATYQQ